MKTLEQYYSDYQDKELDQEQFEQMHEEALRNEYQLYQFYTEDEEQ